MSFLVGILSLLLLVISLFMVLLVLIQRGRGGGLAGAFGGGGGQSAFGTRAGDTFTKVTVVFAVVWVIVAGCLGIAMRGVAAAKEAGEDTLFNAAAVETDETPASDSGDSAPVKAADLVDAAANAEASSQETGVAPDQPAAETTAADNAAETSGAANADDSSSNESPGAADASEKVPSTEEGAGAVPENLPETPSPDEAAKAGESAPKE